MTHVSRSPVCTCGRTLTLVPDRFSSRGAAYRAECAVCGSAERLFETDPVDPDPERTSLRSAVLALADELAAVS